MEYSVTSMQDLKVAQKSLVRTRVTLTFTVRVCFRAILFLIVVNDVWLSSIYS